VKSRLKKVRQVFKAPRRRQAPDYVEPFRAYRAWKFEDDQLQSLNGVAWEPRQAMVASCGSNASLIKQHLSPHTDCTCGIYAGKNLEHLVDINYAQMGIHGEVDLWGTILECELGYRAQYAYPRYFVIPPELLANFHRAEFRLALLAQFEVDIYVAAEATVSRNMEKIMLLPKGQSMFSAEGVDRLTANVQRVYEYMGEQAKRTPEVGDRLHIKEHGISVITEVTADWVCAMLYTTTICRVLRKEVRWNVENFRLECNPSSFYTRAVAR
jgi:hypothetical protein